MIEMGIHLCIAFLKYNVVEVCHGNPKSILNKQCSYGGSLTVFNGRLKQFFHVNLPLVWGIRQK